MNRASWQKIQDLFSWSWCNLGYRCTCSWDCRGGHGHSCTCSAHGSCARCNGKRVRRHGSWFSCCYVGTRFWSHCILNALRTLNDFVDLSFIFAWIALKDIPVIWRCKPLKERLLPMLHHEWCSWEILPRCHWTCRNGDSRTNQGRLGTQSLGSHSATWISWSRNFDTEWWLPKSRFVSEKHSGQHVASREDSFVGPSSCSWTFGGAHCFCRLEPLSTDDFAVHFVFRPLRNCCVCPSTWSLATSSWSSYNCSSAWKLWGCNGSHGSSLWQVSSWDFFSYVPFFHPKKRRKFEGRYRLYGLFSEVNPRFMDTLLELSLRGFLPHPWITLEQMQDSAGMTWEDVDEAAGVWASFNCVEIANGSVRLLKDEKDFWTEHKWSLTAGLKGRCDCIVELVVS